MKTGDKIRTTFLWRYIIKVSVWCFVLVTSLSAHTRFVGNAVECDEGDVKTYRKNIKYSKKYVVTAHYRGVAVLCMGKERKGMSYLKKASSLGHVEASRLVALYYKTDRTLDIDYDLTRDPGNLNTAIYYYERAASQIEKTPLYPEGATKDIPYLEEKHCTSAKVFDTLPYLYYAGYAKAIQDSLNTNNKYSDLTKMLVKMRDSAKRCLQRPALAIWQWQSKRQTVWNFLQVRCGAIKNFAEEVLILEPERAAITRKCEGSLGKCPGHKEIFDQIKAAVHLMLNTIDTVPPDFDSLMPPYSCAPMTTGY